jgi:Fe2+ transport system protein B
MLEASENVFISFSLLKRPLFLSQDILNQMDNITTELKTKLNELETDLEENEKIGRQTLELKFTATEEYDNAARRVEDIDIAKLKEEIKQEKQRMKNNLKRVQDECASHAEIRSALQEEERKLKEGEETSQSIKDHMLDVAEQVRAHFAELDEMYDDLIKKMMAVNDARDESLKHFFED